MSKYAAARKIFNFYIDNLNKDREKPEATYSLQLANLKVLKMQTQNILDSMQSFELEYSE